MHYKVNYKHRQYTFSKYFSNLGRGPRIHVSNKFSGDADTADHGRTMGLKQQRTYDVPKNTLSSRMKATLY